jgi:hypothetical protein
MFEEFSYPAPHIPDTESLSRPFAEGEVIAPIFFTAADEI